MKEKAEFAWSGVRWDTRGSVVVVAVGKDWKCEWWNAWEVTDKQDESDVESLFAGKMEMKMRNFWEMGTKMHVKCWTGVWSEKPVWEWGRGSKNSGADSACEAWLKHLWDLRGKPRVPGLIPLVLSAFVAASPCADTSVEEFAALWDCASRISAVTVEVLSLLMVHRKSQCHVMGEVWPLLGYSIKQ